MFDPDNPVFAPLLLPTDRDALKSCGPLQAAILPATVAVNERLAPLHLEARGKAASLLVDPRTAAFQFEGYVSMEDVRALPYSPGRGTLGALWAPEQFSRPYREMVIGGVVALQEHLHADAIAAPYFLVPGPDHPWLEVAVDIGRETRARAGKKPVVVNVCVDIDSILAAPPRATFSDAFSDTGADLFMLTVVNFDEVEATPDEVRAVLDLLSRLGTSAPTLLLYVGRAGLAAVAHGAAGFGGGSLELEAHPRRYLREGLVNLHSDTHYLPGAMLRLPVRLAASVAERVPQADATDAPLATRLVRRVRAQRALDAKAGEALWLGNYTGSERPAALKGRLDEALRVCETAQVELADGDSEPLTRSAFHYLEVLREIAGGEKAELLGGASF